MYGATNANLAFVVQFPNLIDVTKLGCYLMLVFEEGVLLGEGILLIFILLSLMIKESIVNSDGFLHDLADPIWCPII